MTSTSLLDLTVTHWSEIPTLCRYFDRLNQSEFAAVADLFAPEGQLQPPFEEPITGSEAIAAYLAQEASNMQLEPLQGELTTLETGSLLTTHEVNVPWLLGLLPGVPFSE
ncbi:MAG: hypothetical protein F6K04_22140, partial [Leptolyngbya sp. SIO4C5]|nr:hypothetical protein [Leptolyngbya sp. SIO4C5]